MPDFNSWDPNPQRLVLHADEIHVWRASLDCADTVIREFEATLASDERVRAQRFVFQPDRNGFIATRGILRELLARYLNLSPADLAFDYGPQGKPTLRTGSSAGSSKKKVEFNVSHSHGMALLAFSLARQLGVDVELIRSDFASEKIAERFFSSQEVAELRGLPKALQDEAFFLCWTRKEAYIKARGEGLQVPLKSFSVSLTPGEPERLQAADSSRWSLRSLRPDPRYAGAVVAEGNSNSNGKSTNEDWQLRGWEWRPQDRR
jgi:4'-phosphopantetheinyl transferase